MNLTNRTSAELPERSSIYPATLVHPPRYAPSSVSIRVRVSFISFHVHPCLSASICVSCLVSRISRQVAATQEGG